MKRNSILMSFVFILLLCFITVFPSGIFRVITLILILGYVLLIVLPHFSRIYFSRMKTRIYETKRKENAEKQMKEIREISPRKSFVIPDVDDYSQHQVMLHLTRRITEHLKQYYPSAHWSFTDTVPLQDMLGGLPFRIQVYEVGSWNYADVSFGNRAEIQIDLLKLSSLSSSLNMNENELVSTGDAITWFENYGIKKMMDFYSESAAHGWDAFFIDLAGKVFFLEEGEENVLGYLDQFPKESEWECLSQCLKQDHIDSVIMSGIFKIIVKI